MIENYYIPVNPATIRAREILNNFAIERNKNFNIYEEEEKKETPVQELSPELQCIVCTRNGIKTKYPRETMLEIERTSRTKDGKIRKFKQHLCPKHAAEYKPHSKSVGGRNY